MKLSNIRTEDFLEEGIEKTRLICDVECGFSDEKAVWFTVDREYKDWLCTDTYDAFLMAMLMPVMYYNENLEIDGYVSRKVYINVLNYVIPSKHAYDPNTSIPQISVLGYKEPAKTGGGRIGLGFGGGVDSFTSLHDHYFQPIDEENVVDTLCFFLTDNYGSALDPNSKVRALAFFENTKSLADELKMNAVYVDSTCIFKFHPRADEQYILTEREQRIFINGLWARIACAMAIQGGLKRFIMSSSSSYKDSLLYQCEMYKSGRLWLDEWSAIFVLPLLSNTCLEFVEDGEKYNSRTEKIERIINNPLVHKHIRVCSGAFDNGKDCGRCKKCKRFLLTIEILGRLDEFKDHFDLDYYRKHMFAHKCTVVRLAYDTDDLFAQDLVELAKKYNYKMPSIWTARLYVLTHSIYIKLRLYKIKQWVMGK